MGVYLKQFFTGLRFPIHQRAQAILQHYGVALCMLTPNATAVVFAFLSYCLAHGLDMTIFLFSYFFQLKMVPRSGGWYYFTARPARKFLWGEENHPHGWEDKFVYASCRGAVSEDRWAIPGEYRLLQKKRVRGLNREPMLTPAERSAAEMILGVRGREKNAADFDIRQLVRHAALAAVGLCRCPPSEVPEGVEPERGPPVPAEEGSLTAMWEEALSVPPREADTPAGPSGGMP